MKRDPKEIAEALMRKAGVPTCYAASSELLAEAEEYVSALSLGCQILEETDEPVIGTFRHLIPMLLRARGLDIDDSEPGVWLVVERVRPGLIFNDADAQRGHAGNFVVSKRTVWV